MGVRQQCRNLSSWRMNGTIYEAGNLGGNDQGMKF